MKGFGIAALVISIIAIFIPIVGAFMAGLAGILAIFSAGKGTSFGLAAVILNIVNIILLSPSLIIAAGAQLQKTGETEYTMAFGYLLLIQALAILVFISKWFLSYRKEKQA